jgi:hypothetical protein
MRIEERWPNQTVRRGLGKSQHGGASCGGGSAGQWLCASWGGSAGQVLHSQGSLGRRGFRADALGGNGCYDPMLVPALSRCCLGVWMWVGREAKGLFGDRLVERGTGVVCVLWGGSAGQVLHSQGSLGRRGYRADALGGSVATIQCLFRPCPAAAAFLGGEQRAFAERGLGGIRCRH